jgi:hypothetical protein
VNLILTMPEGYFSEMLAKATERRARNEAQGKQLGDAAAEDDDYVDQQQQQQVRRRGREAASSSSSSGGGSKVNGLNGSAAGSSVLQATAAKALSSRARKIRSSRADEDHDTDSEAVEGVLGADSAWRDSLANVFQQTSEELRRAVVGAGSAAAAAMAGRSRRQK